MATGAIEVVPCWDGKTFTLEGAPSGAADLDAAVLFLRMVISHRARVASRVKAAGSARTLCCATRMRPRAGRILGS